MFADDTNIFIADKDINEVYRKANKVLKCVLCMRVYETKSITH